MGVPKAFHVRIDHLMWGFSGKGVASALVTGPWNWIGGRKDRVSGGCTLVHLLRFAGSACCMFSSTLCVVVCSVPSWSSASTNSPSFLF